MESFVNELAIIPKINTNIERLKQEIGICFIFKMKLFFNSLKFFFFF